LLPPNRNFLITAISRITKCYWSNSSSAQKNYFPKAGPLFRFSISHQDISLQIYKQKQTQTAARKSGKFPQHCHIFVMSKYSTNSHLISWRYIDGNNYLLRV
jgi:hypothetical protein